MSNTSVKNEHKLFSSPIVAVAATTTIANVGVSSQVHYIGARYYTSSAGTTTVTPGAGTVAVAGLDEATNQWTDSAGTLACTDVTDKETITANVTSIRGVPTGITTATHWQLFSSSNV
jgi:hypothetical protein